jgi:hypothetical protein
MDIDNFTLIGNNSNNINHLATCRQIFGRLARPIFKYEYILNPFPIKHYRDSVVYSFAEVVTSNRSSDID